MDKKIILKKRNIPSDLLKYFKLKKQNRWLLRNRVCWHKPNSMPSSAEDRFSSTWEYLFFFVKSNKTQYWTNFKTFELVTKQPQGTKGEKGKDWEWVDCSKCEGIGLVKKSGVKTQFPKDLMDCPRCKGTRKIKKNLWEGHDYFFDLDAVREPHKEDSKRRSMRGTSADNKYALGSNFPAGVHANTMSQSREFRGYEGMEEAVDSGETTLHPAGKNPGDHFEITTQPLKEYHYASFPEKLLEKPIKAGCPQWICKKCKKIRERITDVERKTTRPDPKDSKYGNEKEDIRGGSINLRQRIVASYKTTGFTDCGCNDAKGEPGIVLDPFMGSGTTAVVAWSHYRDYIGFELNPDYIKIAERRILRATRDVASFFAKEGN